MADASSRLQIITGDQIPGVESHLSKIVAWVRDAARPYYEILLRGSNQDLLLRDWILRESSEIALHHMRILIADDDISGGYIALSGREIDRCRQADLLDLARRQGPSAYADIRARVRDLHGLLSPIRRSDFYLSRIAILPHKRGQGLAHHLIRDSLDRAEKAKAHRVRLDVNEDNDIALSLFEQYDFEVDYRGHAPQANLFYEGMKREL